MHCLFLAEAEVDPSNVQIQSASGSSYLHVMPDINSKIELAALDAHIHERGEGMHISLNAPLLHLCCQVQCPVTANKPSNL